MNESLAQRLMAGNKDTAWNAPPAWNGYPAYVMLMTKPAAKAEGLIVNCEYDGEYATNLNNEQYTALYDAWNENRAITINGKPKWITYFSLCGDG